MSLLKLLLLDFFQGGTGRLFGLRFEVGMYRINFEYPFCASVHSASNRVAKWILGTLRVESKGLAPYSSPI